MLRRIHVVSREEVAGLMGSTVIGERLKKQTKIYEKVLKLECSEKQIDDQ